MATQYSNDTDCWRKTHL